MTLNAKVDSVAGESFTIEVLASATAANGLPTGDAGIDVSQLAAGLGRVPKSVRFGINSTAGSGTMTVTLRAWLYAGGIWFVAKALNAASTAPQTAVAIPETSANAIAYTEEVDIRGAGRLYLEIVSTPGGDALTKAELALDPLTTGNMDTVLEATTGGTAGNSLTIALVHSAGAPNGGTLTRVGNAFTFTFKGGTTTVGNFETADPTPAQLRSLEDLCRWLARLCGIPPANFVGHGAAHGNQTLCPGKRLDLESLRKRLSAPR